MCGIAGVINLNHGITSGCVEKLKKSLAILANRGPDGEGLYSDQNVCFGHRRLSIFDISSNGSQPMLSSNGRFVIVFNGEIYNYLELKKFLNEFHADLNWKSSSDTEVLLNLIEKFGLNKTLSLIKGMFAFSIYDKIENVVFIVRDIFGEKPLYYYTNEDLVVFGSDLRIVRENTNASTINESTLLSYLKFGYCIGTNSILKSINKLKPGTFLKITKTQITSEEYYNFNNYAHRPVSKLSFGERYQNLKSAFYNSIVQTSRSDVPLGVLLSGGIDSSLIASVLSQQKKISTFTLAFSESEFDESKIASRVSKYLGTDHHELLFTSKDAYELIPLMASVYDEPFADISQLPTFAISKFARSKVTVGLSGDGGDELFFGYKKYFQMQKLNTFFKILPTKILNVLNQSFGNYFLSKSQVEFLKDIFIDKANLPLVFASSIRNPRKFLVSCVDELPCAYSVLKDDCDFHTNVRISDLVQYLPDNILVKTDRASMYSSLELRAPFLDKDILLCAFDFNLNELYHHGVGKMPLRKMLHEIVPHSVYNVQFKRGFSIPIEKWLRYDLKDYVFDCLSETKVRSQGIFEWKSVSQILHEHYKYEINRSLPIWTLLNFQLWFNANMGK